MNRKTYFRFWGNNKPIAYNGIGDIIVNHSIEEIECSTIAVVYGGQILAYLDHEDLINAKQADIYLGI